MKIRKRSLIQTSLLAFLIGALGMPITSRADGPPNLEVESVSFPATEGITVSNVTVATFTDPVPGEDATNYTATIDWGDGTVEAGIISTNGTGGFDVSGTHLYAEEGTDTVTISIADLDGSSGVTNMTEVVADAPLMASGQTIAPVEDNAFSGEVASFTDANTNSAASDFGATIDWGDGTTSAGIVTGEAGAFKVSGNHTYAEEGTFAIGISISDIGGSSASAGSTANVSDALLTASGTTISINEGSSFEGTVATLVDANLSATPADFAAQIAWGDGTTTPGVVALTTPGNFSVSGTHTYAEEGSYAVTVSVVDAGGSLAEAGSTANVGDAALTADGNSVASIEGSPFSGIVATFTDANPNATAAEFSATIKWGDGSTSVGLVEGNGAGFNVSGTHTYAEEGSYAISVRIADVGGSSATAGSTVQVTDAALNSSAVPIASVEGAPFSGVIATVTDANPFAAPSDFTAVILWGDGSSSAGSVTAVEGGGFNVSASHTYIEEGSYAVTVDVADTGGSITSVGTTATVTDAPLTAVGRTITPLENSSFVAVVASVVDANPNGTADDFSATIDWGDGVITSGSVVASGAARFDVIGSHTYGHEGLYTMHIAIADVGGASCAAVSVADARDTGLVASGATVTGVKGVPFTQVVATAVESDVTPEGTESYTCVINWGDGSTSAGTMMPTETGAYSIVGSHTYALSGSYVVLVTIDDAQNFISTSARSTALVSEVPAVDISSQLQIKATKPRLDKRTNLVKQVLTIKNLSGVPVRGPISIVFDNLQNEGGSINLVNQDGQIQTPALAPTGSGYKNVPMPRNNLLARKATRTITVYFDGGSTGISYSLRTLAGTGSR
jgi:hypothetical protein